jgi:hypothetical protein
MPGIMDELDNKKSALKDLIKALALMPKEESSPELKLEGTTSVEKAGQDVPAQGQNVRGDAEAPDDGKDDDVKAIDKKEMAMTPDDSQSDESNLGKVKTEPSMMDKMNFDDISLDELKSLKKKMQEKGIL